MSGDDFFDDQGLGDGFDDDTDDEGLDDDTEDDALDDEHHDGCFCLDCCEAQLVGLVTVAPDDPDGYLDTFGAEGLADIGRAVMEAEEDGLDDMVTTYWEPDGTGSYVEITFDPKSGDFFIEGVTTRREDGEGFHEIDDAQRIDLPWLRS